MPRSGSFPMSDIAMSRIMNETDVKDRDKGVLMVYLEQIQQNPEMKEYAELLLNGLKRNDKESIKKSVRLYNKWLKTVWSQPILGKRDRVDDEDDHEDDQKRDRVDKDDYEDPKRLEMYNEIYPFDGEPPRDGPLGGRRKSKKSKRKSKKSKRKGKGNGKTHKRK